MKRRRCFAFFAAVFTFTFSLQTSYALTWSELGPEQIVQAEYPPSAIQLSGYTAPSYVDWNNDGKKDLIVGAEHTEITQNGPVESGKVYVYLNEGQDTAPVFNQSFFAQSDANDLSCPVSGCMSCFPRVVYWDADDRKDLLMGQSDGLVKIFLNTNTDEDPSFDGGTMLQVGPAGAKQDLVVFLRATPCVVDWNNDEKKDLVVGAYDGKMHLFINEGTDTEPNFLQETIIQQDANDLIVPALRSSPCVYDVDRDRRKDLLSGDTKGQLLLYLNVGTDPSPAFSGYTLVESDGAAIDLPSSSPSDDVRSRPFICDWTGDGYLDVLVGAGTSNVYLFEGLVFGGDMEPDGDVDLADFAVFASWWQDNDCGSKEDCGGADISGDGNVYFDDLTSLVSNWLAGDSI